VCLPWLPLPCPLGHLQRLPSLLGRLRLRRFRRPPRLPPVDP
jgi:hypothetical protein